MRGFSTHDDGTSDDFESPGNLAPWEALVVDAVGSVIDFWQFKRNQGRVWALLYLRGRPHTAQDLQDALGLSKGAVSILVRELEQWGVVRRVRTPADPMWRYEAETDLMKMVRKVIEEREAMLVTRVRRDLERAEAMARESDAPRDVRARLERMRRLSGLVEKSLLAFLKTARLDVLGAFQILAGK
ncbi:MAG: MarR family transcriptional regulator [Deltaproteobacteria bacterium]|nr:MarR family transcriptional regulator [Deltaproteobacteria bacterium]